MELSYVDVVSMLRELSKPLWEIDFSSLPNVWGISAPWLLSHGYRLYPTWEDRYDSTICTPDHPAPRDLPHPYAYSAYLPGPCNDVSLPQNVIGAQDKHWRDVVIKIVAKGSQELTIFNILLETPELFDSATFPCVIPVLDILDTPYDYVFVVLPRWGQPEMMFSDVGEFLFFISSMLRGLCFLHERRIAHRDISESNFLMNYFHYNYPRGVWSHPDLIPFRAGRMSLQPQYCLFDFNQSVVFPRKAPLNMCRLPDRFSWSGTPKYHPTDLNEGELDYDPFAFDVGCLGFFLLQNFHYIVPAVPLVAPLLEHMITDDIKRRFTAVEALQFCDDIKLKATEEDLTTPIPRPTSVRPLEVPWKLLPPDFVAQWSHWRNAPPSYQKRLLRWIDAFDWGHAIIQLFRQAFRFLGGSRPSYIMGHWDYTK